MLSEKSFILLIFTLTILLTTPVTSVQANEDTSVQITEIYSDMNSCDITIQSSSMILNPELEVKLSNDEEILRKVTIPIEKIKANSTLIKVIDWEIDETDEGAYHVRAILHKGDENLVDTTYSFVHGKRVIPEIVLDGMISNSEGISAVITPQEPVIVDIEYMLVDGNDVIYFTRDEKVPIHTYPLAVHKQWNSLLDNNKEYMGRMKVRPDDKQKTALVTMRSFTSMDDARVTDVYKDEIGASCTVIGMSQVPFEGLIHFTVSDMDGKTMILEKIKSPVLLTEDDETVEAIWDPRLDEGKYDLLIEVIGNDGDVLDTKGTVIDVETSSIPETVDESLSSPTSKEQDETGEAQTPAFMTIHALLAIIIAAGTFRSKK